MKEERGFIIPKRGKALKYKMISELGVAKETTRYEGGKILKSKLLWEYPHAIDEEQKELRSVYKHIIVSPVIGISRIRSFGVGRSVIKEPYDIEEIPMELFKYYLKGGAFKEDDDDIDNNVDNDVINGIEDIAGDASDINIIVTQKETVHKKVSNGDVFYYCYIGYETHGRPSFILWVSSKLVKRKEKEDKIEEYIQFPVKDAGIIVTEKGTKILKPDYGKVTFYLLPVAGYRGDSEINIITDVINEFDFRSFHSERGNLGISKGKLATVDKKNLPVKFRWERSGRLYGKPSQGITIVNEDGQSETFESLEDELEDMKKLLD